MSGSTEKYGWPSRMLYTTLALFPYVASSASTAVTWMTEVPGRRRRFMTIIQVNVSIAEETAWRMIGWADAPSDEVSDLPLIRLVHDVTELFGPFASPATDILIHY